MYASSYNNSLVLCSLFVAILAAYTALNVSARIATAQRRVVGLWLAGGAFAMGVGTWSMHFTGMLAFHLPVPVGYDLTITFFSIGISVASSALALWLVSQNKLSRSKLIWGSLLIGTGVSAMHYTGMAAMRMKPGIRYSPSLFTLSILIAFFASGAGLWIAFYLRQCTTKVRLYRLGASVVIGVAILSMDYTGMAAAHFPVGSISGAAKYGVEPGWQAFLVIGVTLAVLSIASIVSLLDMRMESRTSIMAKSLAQANEELTYLALHDNLTKLPNRTLFEGRLSQAIENAEREQLTFSVMFMDLDGYKAVNDIFGHHVGDLLLIEVADRIRKRIRPEDTIARVGGDEFLLLMSEGDPEQAANIAHELVAAIGEPFDIEGDELRVSLSIGLAMYPSDGTTQHELLRNADAAMYHVKTQGRNAYHFFERSMNANVHEQLQLLHDLRLAIAHQEFILHYQPKFDVSDQSVIGAEALLRWMHPRRGMISPDDFIPLAEKTGLIVPIGEWVLNEACRQMAEWRQAGHSTWTMAVNLSSLQFDNIGLVETVRKTLERHSLDPSHLILEVTESTAMHDLEASMRILRQLADMGVHISIDDFGRGYSSLLYLKRLPANELKIDRGFVHDLVQDSGDAAIVSAIVSLGQKLNLKIVAEGVETLAQQEFLIHLGCNSLQGFLLGRPMPADMFLETVAVGACPSGVV
jgi:diguanylate cyclase